MLTDLVTVLEVFFLGVLAGVLLVKGMNRTGRKRSPDRDPGPNPDRAPRYSCVICDEDVATPVFVDDDPMCLQCAFMTYKDQP